CSSDLFPPAIDAAGGQAPPPARAECAAAAAGGAESSRPRWFYPDPLHRPAARAGWHPESPVRQCRAGVVTDWYGHRADRKTAAGAVCSVVLTPADAVQTGYCCQSGRKTAGRWADSVEYD